MNTEFESCSVDLAEDISSISTTEEKSLKTKENNSFCMKSVSEEETSLSSSEEADLLEENLDDETNGSKKTAVDNTVSSWEMRESIEITLTAQSEDTVTTEERLDIPENGEPVGGDDDLDTRSEVSSSQELPDPAVLHILYHQIHHLHILLQLQKKKMKVMMNPEATRESVERIQALITTKINCPNVPKKSQKENLGNMITPPNLTTFFVMPVSSL